jgi:hypothetical protein
MRTRLAATVAVTALSTCGIIAGTPTAHAAVSVCGDSAAAYNGVFVPASPLPGDVESLTFDGNGNISGSDGKTITGTYSATGTGMTFTYAFSADEPAVTFATRDRICDDGLLDLTTVTAFSGTWNYVGSPDSIALDFDKK